MNAQDYSESTEEYIEQVRKKIDEKLDDLNEKVIQKLENTLDKAKASRKECGMSDEKLRILQMIKDRTLTPEEGLDLIQALDMSESSALQNLSRSRRRTIHRNRLRQTANANQDFFG